jgi:hypothetical protein
MGVATKYCRTLQFRQARLYPFSGFTVSPDGVIDVI